MNIINFNSKFERPIQYTYLNLKYTSAVAGASATQFFSVLSTIDINKYIYYLGILTFKVTGYS